MDLALGSLKHDQLRAHQIVDWHPGDTLRGTSLPPLRTILHGEGGAGKLRVIQMITESFPVRGVGHMLIKAACTGVGSGLKYRSLITASSAWSAVGIFDTLPLSDVLRKLLSCSHGFTVRSMQPKIHQADQGQKAQICCEDICPVCRIHPATRDTFCVPTMIKKLEKWWWP